ncbi:MAG: tRNA (adenine-N1)-methyltransferase [Deltaproteobacteria bacterium]|nr:MAG: tRNA (adenine-N1)-methyltransferase [Deltaproteobacteria bacterium]
MTQPIAEGECIILLDPTDEKEFFFKMRKGGHINLHKGKILHDEIIGKSEGAVVHSSRGNPFLILRPTLYQFIMHMKRDTQIIYPKDLALILVYADIYPGCIVLEAGIGSGALTLALLRGVGEKGKVISYEVREEFIRRAKKNIGLFLGDPPNLEVKQRDIYEGIEEKGLDRVILDVPEPWRVVNDVAESLRPGGMLLGYLPTIIQVKSLVDALREDRRFSSIQVFESLIRNWNIEGLSVRPFHRMVAHTGFLTLARRGKIY